MRDYKVNELISLKLVDDNTIIYVNGDEFVQCKGVVLNRTLDELKHISFDWSIDELADHAEHEGTWDLVSPETEFLVHCSNLSAWAENNYNSELLHSNLAFPLLKKLVEEGDETAKRVFKEEIIKRLESGYLPVITYLSEEEYDEYLTREEWYNAILGHDRQGFREADALLDLEAEIGKKLILVKEFHDQGRYELCIEDGRVQGLLVDESETPSLPRSIGDLIYIREFDCINSRIKEIPETIKNLTNLRSLDLHGNDLNKIPESIGELSQLDYLNLSHNQLNSLPESIGELSQLKILNLSHNQLNSLPESIGKLSQLFDLDLSHNNLDTLPDSFNQLKNMWDLNLCHNKLTEIATKIEFFNNLGSLDISYNNIEVLGSNIKTLASLVSLNISDNQIADFEPLTGLLKLKELYISNNNLSNFPEGVEKMRNLTLLALSKNSIKELPKSVINMGSSLTINLRGNPEFTISDLFLEKLKEKDIEIIFF